MYIFRVHDYVNKLDSTDAFVHPNLMSLDIHIINVDFSINGTNAETFDFLPTLLAHLSPHNRTRCRLAMFGVSNLNFEQVQRIVFERNISRFSCLLLYVRNFHSLPNFDRIRQLPLFNRLQSISTNIDGVVVRWLKWTNTYDACMK
ncbi:unnamed protein product [Rotaria sp. Silwood1]|nr:unnamed protein product [Rotaria sp. Silwood1]